MEISDTYDNAFAYFDCPERIVATATTHGMVAIATMDGPLEDDAAANMADFIGDEIYKRWPKSGASDTMSREHIYLALLGEL